MTKKVLSIVSFALAFAILVPLSVTTSASEVNCRVPFSFVVAGKTMPPGRYSVATSQGYMVLRGLTHNAVVLTLSERERANGQARFVFLKTGDRYDLAEIWSGDGTGCRSRPPSTRPTRASPRTPRPSASSFSPTRRPDPGRIAACNGPLLTMGGERLPPVRAFSLGAVKAPSGLGPCRTRSGGQPCVGGDGCQIARRVSVDAEAVAPGGSEDLRERGLPFAHVGAGFRRSVGWAKNQMFPDPLVT